jgi:hypothetical protein
MLSQSCRPESDMEHEESIACVTWATPVVIIRNLNEKQI